MVGGISAICGAYVCGPRLGRYDANNQLVEMPGHSSTLQALGTFILWVGWYGFNPGSTLAITGGLGGVAGKCACTTTLAAAAGALGCLTIYKVSSRTFDLGQTLNGVLAGLVSITAGCSVVEPYAAVIIGLIGSLVYKGVSELVKRVLKIDDVVDAFAVHCGGGMWGVIAASLFATQENYMAAYGVDETAPYGAFYAPTGKGHQMFGCAIVGILAIWAWVGCLMLPFFAAVHSAGWLRSTPEEEEAGMDVSKHGGSAYPDYVAVVHAAAPPASTTSKTTSNTTK
jgi:Amt family ammonium transporter